jgi:hypothetical protein
MSISVYGRPTLYFDDLLSLARVGTASRQGCLVLVVIDVMGYSE